MSNLNLLDETDIPTDLLPRSRAWFQGQTARLQRIHGDNWPAVSEWLGDYLNTELRGYVQRA